MERSPARPQFHRCRHLCGWGIKRLGNTAGAGTGIALGDRRAIRLGSFRFPNLRCLPDVESDVGRVHSRPKTMAKWHLLVIDNSDLAGCSSNRFRAPLTNVWRKIAITLICLPRGDLSEMAFHEKAGRRQVDFDLPFLKSPFPSWRRVCRAARSGQGRVLCGVANP